MSNHYWVHSRSDGRVSGCNWTKKPVSTGTTNQNLHSSSFRGFPFCAHHLKWKKQIDSNIELPSAWNQMSVVWTRSISIEVGVHNSECRDFAIKVFAMTTVVEKVQSFSAHPSHSSTAGSQSGPMLRRICCCRIWIFSGSSVHVST